MMEKKLVENRRSELVKELEALRTQLVQTQQNMQLIPQAIAARQGAIDEIDRILKNKEGEKDAGTNARPKTPKSE